MTTEVLGKDSVIFNTWKHHRGFIMSEIKTCVSDENGRQRLLDGLVSIGTSVMDVYLGQLPPSQISTEIIKYLQVNHIDDATKYTHWLNGHNSYRLIDISDDSNWTLRWGNDVNKFIHIHPSRYSKDTFRIKAIALKTIIVTHFWCLSHREMFSLETVNLARQELLNEPPIKQISDEEGIGKLFNLLKADR